MKLSELRNKIENTPLPVRDIMGCWNQESKQMRLSQVEKMLSLAGDHNIPSNGSEYADLLDKLLPEPETDKIAWDQMDLARSILAINKIHDK